MPIIKIPRLSIILGIAVLSLFFALSSVHAQEFDFGGFGGWDYGFDSFGGLSGSGYGYGGSYDPCGFGGCGSGVSYDVYGGSYGYGGGCGSSCFGGFGFGGYSYQPFAPFIPPAQSSVYAPRSVYAPTTIDDHSVVTTTIHTTSAPAYPSSYPVYISQPVYTAPPVYYSPPVYTPPPVYYPPPSYQPPIVCSVQLSNFSPPTTALPWQLYSYRVIAVSAVHGQMSYRLVTAPDGMGINSATGQITWTPGTNQARSTAYQVTVATYNGSCETAQTFYVTVRNAPILYTPPVVITHVAPKPKPKPAPVDSSICPSTQTTPSTRVDGDNVLANAASGFWGGITALFASPFTLLLVIIILIILLVRANRRRLNETPVVI